MLHNLENIKKNKANHLQQACQTGEPFAALGIVFLSLVSKTYLHFIENFSESTRNWYKKLYLAIRIDLL